MDILLTTDGIHILVNVVIIDLILANLVSQPTFSWGVIVTIVAFTKKGSIISQLTPKG
jgi:hypothetical protein